MAWHELTSEKPVAKREYLAIVKQKEIITKKVKDFEETFKGANFENETQYRIVTDKNFSALVVLEYLLNNYEIEEIYLAIYRMNLPAVYKIQEIAQNDKIQMTILVSSFFRENKKYEKWTRELELFCNDKTNVDLKFAWSHAKVILCKTKCGKNMIVEGSGNLSDNARIEQYLIENNKKVYNFHKTWIDDVTDRRAKKHNN